MKPQIEKLILTALLLATAGIAPNLFPIAQAGYAPLSKLALNFLLPSIVFLALITIFLHLRGHRELEQLVRAGLLGGLLGTVGLEAVRHVGFLLGGMPGEMPKLMGVLLLNRFALGPTTLSNLAGWGYHFWNGAAFGIIYTLLAGRGRVWVGTAFGVLIGIGFMVSPVALSLGVGYFGVEYGWGFPVTVTLAHVVFGTILGFFLSRTIPAVPGIIGRLKLESAAAR